MSRITGHRRTTLITGGAGFIGSHLADALVARGETVILLDDLSTGRFENIEHLSGSDQMEFVEGSVLDPDLVDALVGRSGTVCHLASAVGVQLVMQNALETLRRNVHGIDVVLGAAARHRRKLLFTSTSEVYGKNSSDSLSEDSDSILGPPYKTRWSYATAKSFGESMAHSFHREQGCDFTIVRLFNTVGPRQSGHYGMVLPRFVRQAMTGEDLTVFGNGMQSRCFTHVHDAVDAIQLLLESGTSAGSVFNVGTSNEVAVIELARRVIERLGSSSNVALVPYEEAFNEGFEELGRRVPDTTALTTLTGWQATRTIDDAINDVIDFEQRKGDSVTSPPLVPDLADALA